MFGNLTYVFRPILQISTLCHTDAGADLAQGQLRTGGALGIDLGQTDGVGPFLPGFGKAQLHRIGRKVTKQLAAQKLAVPSNGHIIHTAVTA